jgi:hypothetical protein
MVLKLLLMVAISACVFYCYTEHQNKRMAQQVAKEEEWECYHDEMTNTSSFQYCAQIVLVG